MIEKGRLPKIFLGWWTVLSGGFLSFWGIAFTQFGFSALFKPLASELGLNRAATSLAASISRFEGGFEAPLAGWLTDKFGPRWVIFCGVLLLGLGLTLMYFVNSFWSFLLVWGIIVGTGANTGLTLPWDKAITNWFVKRRGLAINIKLVGTGLSVTLGLPLIAWLISIQDWRTACVIGGMVMLVVGLPLVWFFVKQHRPEYYGLLPDGATVKEEAVNASRMIVRGVEYAAEVGEVEFTFRQAMRTPAYWLFIIVGSTSALWAGVMNLHLMPFLTDRGTEPVRAGVIIGMTSSIMIPARLIIGFTVDRVKKSHIRFVIAGAYLLQAVGTIFFLLNQTMAMVYVWLTLYWLGQGISVPLITIIKARYYGRKAFGSILGFSMMLVTPVGIIAPVYAGWVYDTTGSYISAFILLAMLMAFSAAIMVFLLPPKPPAKISDIRQIL